MTDHDKEIPMNNKEKFSSKLSKANIEALKTLSKESSRHISSLLDEAVSEYLKRVGVRQTFKDASKEIIEEHSALLKRLAS